MGLLDGEITVVRALTGSFVDGLYEETNEEITVNGTITTKNQMALYQSLENDLNMSGIDSKGLICVITKQELKTIETSTLLKADVVLHNNKRYKVLSCSGLQQLGNTQHYRQIASLETENI